MTRAIEVPSHIVWKWQEVVNLLATIIDVPSALIMKVDPPNVKVFVASESKGNPYEPDEVACLNTGLYCETVMNTRRPLLVPDALADEDWKSNPDIKLGMISYFGFPVSWPDGEIFGTICVLDNKRNEYGELYRKLLLQFRDVLQVDLRSLATVHAQLTRQKAHVEELFARVPEAIVHVDARSRVLGINPEFTRIFGYTEEEVLGRTLNDLIVPEDLRAEAQEFRSRVNERGEILTVETVRTRKDGTRVAVSIVRVPLMAEGRKISEYAIYRDISDRKRAEQELRNQAELLSLAQDAIIVRDPESRITFWNPGAEKTYGWSTEEAIGKTTHELLQTRFPVSRHVVDLALEEQGEWEGELTHVTRQGTAIIVTSRQSLRRDEDGLPAAILEINRDITERNRAEEALHKAQSDLAHITRATTMGELASSIAHEVNQPLAGLVTNGHACLRWLAGQPPNLDEARECLRRIIRDGNRAAEVITRIRSLVKKSAPAKVTLDLNEMIQEVLEITNPDARLHRVLVRTELAAGLPPVRGDRVQLQQVILNLVMNGIEAMADVTDQTRELLISSRPNESGTVLVSVRDSGVGLDPKNMERVFEAFYTTKADGMGMGLSISRSIVEAHGGRLWAAANDDRGATFHVTLPTGGNVG